MSFTVERAFDLLTSAHANERLAHAYLITGEEGSGKRELAVRLIQLVNAAGVAGSGDDDGTMGFDLDIEPSAVAPVSAEELPALDSLRGPNISVIEPESKSRRITVDAMRVAERALHLAAPSGVTKFAVVIDADRMGVAAENAFLKTLEEPPRASKLLLLTARPEQLLDTILSRCIRIQLHANPERAKARDATPAPETPERLLLDALAAHTTGGKRGVSAALGLMAVFSAALKAEKETIAKLNDAALKEENQHYKNATEGDWLKRRDDHYKALTEAEYQRVRSRYVEHLVAWFGDALRQQNGGKHLDLPAYAAATAALAANLDSNALMKKASAVDALRGNLNTNVHEALALENGFIHAFA